MSSISIVKDGSGGADYLGEMNNLIRFINRRGDVRYFQANIRLEVDGFNPLVIENIGYNAYYHPDALCLSIAHCGILNGDLMRDPEIVFACEFDEQQVLVGLDPCYYRNDYIGIERCAYLEKDGRRMVRRGLIAELRSLAVIWDRNLVDQGFLPQ